MILKKYLSDIQEKTANMNFKEKFLYVLTYYWYHILMFVFIIVLIFYMIHFYIFDNKKPLFTCVIANVESEESERERIAKELAEEAGLDFERINIEADYLFSYGDVSFQGVNESFYEKFFFKWRNQEIDAVILPESLYDFCREMGGEFRSIANLDTKEYEVYPTEENPGAVVLGKAKMIAKVTGNENEKMLLAFPDTGKHEELCGSFWECVKDIKAEQIGEER